MPKKSPKKETYKNAPILTPAKFEPGVHFHKPAAPTAGVNFHHAKQEPAVKFGA